MPPFSCLSRLDMFARSNGSSAQIFFLHAQEKVTMTKTYSFAVYTL